ncbi:MAG: GNAT family N-acetyltransferase [Thermoanaerobaculia bacterium]
MEGSGEFRCKVGGRLDAFLRFAEDDASFVLDLVLVPKAARHRGVGSLLVERLILLADSVGKPVRLVARPVGQSSTEALERLAAFYRRFGFIETDRRLTSILMSRPASSPTHPSRS